jgi:hypothetical protein
MTDNYKYTCICCNFKSNNKKNYNIHLNTNKHKSKITFYEENNNDKKNLELEIKEKDLLLLEKDLMIQKLELDKKTYIQNQTNNNIENQTNNQIDTQNQYNISFNFNTTCPDAINIKEFLLLIKESLPEMIPDADHFIKQKLEDSITDIVLKNYAKIDDYKKPYYTLDSKRHKTALKDENNEWVDMDEEKINEVTKKFENVIGSGICENFGSSYLNDNQNSNDKELGIPENEKEKDKLLEIINRSTQEIDETGRKKIYKKMCKKGVNKKSLIKE